MGNVNFWSAFQFNDPASGSMESGSPDVPLILQGVNGQKYTNQALDLTQNSSVTLWTNNLGPTLFNFAYIISDVGDDTNGLVMVELCNDPNSPIDFYTIALKAGLPFILCSDRSYSDYVAHFGGGTLDRIRSIKCQNLNTASANVTLWLVY